MRTVTDGTRHYIVMRFWDNKNNNWEYHVYVEAVAKEGVRDIAAHLGGAIKGGTVYGQTDDFSYNIVENPVHVRDLHATILHLMGIDHRKFTHKWQGVDMKLTGVDAEAQVVKDLLA